VERDRFLEEHWERGPLAVERDEAGRYDDLLSLEDVERLVCSGGLRFPAFRLVRADAKLATSDYTADIPWRPTGFSSAADVPRVLREFEHGATIVLQALHLTHPPLGEFCRVLESELGHPAQTNAYFTPREAQGLPVHHDTHDVFVLQVAGEKRWLVYEPALHLPLRDQRYSPELGAPGEAVHDLTLRSGDTLYLPRGWLHEAVTSTTDSLHLTIGLNVYTQLEALRAALESCSADVHFRRSLPADGRLDDTLLERLRTRLEPTAVAGRMRDKLVRSRRAVLGDGLAQLRALDTLDLETEIERRPTVIADLHSTERGVTISFEGKRIRFPAHARAEAEFAVQAGEPFRPADLPGQLDDAGKLTLVRRLIREGFLRITDAGSLGERRG
jgi:lysine-specific demethylase/histidyl-hydroxylase NO66